MNKKVIFNTMLVVVGVSAIALATKMILFPKKEKLAKELALITGGSFDNIIGYDYGYLWHRVRSLKSGKETFDFKGKTYSAKTGKAV